jgi:hypothetical protein
MQTLRRAHLLARFVLVWFALALGAAIASPLVKPQAMELVCSTAGVVKLVHTGDDGNAPAGHLLDCPLCLTGSAPPPSLQLALSQPPVLPPVLVPHERAPLAGHSAAPPPSRGPPLFA